jgi:cell wall-associated NlpC family hydrolase
MSWSLRALVVLGSVATAVLPAGAAHATPSLAEARRQVSALARQMELATEQYHETMLAAAATRAQVSGLERRALPLRVARDRAEARLAASAASAYVGGRYGQLGALLGGGNTRDLLDRMRFLVTLTDEQRARVDTAVSAARRLDRALAPKKALLTRQAAQERALRDRRAVIAKDLVRWELLQARAMGLGDEGFSPVVPSTYTGPAEGRARVALDFAYAQLGKPYRFAAAGPHAYDCSGLTMAAWASAGVRMAHGARAQYAAFRKVPFSDLRPGDLVFYGRPIHHVAMAVGNGRVIHAPQAGDVVRIVSLARGGGRPVGAVRPG